MGTWNSRGLRGSTLEDLINHTNDLYREKKLALIQKIPTPITPIEIDKSSRHITLAYFDQKSTVDYIGAVQGIPVCFDAKECAVKTFPLQNIHPHQIEFMGEFEKQGGIAFIILYFTGLDEIYYLPFEQIEGYWKRMEEGGRKSFTYDEVDKNWRVRSHAGFLVHYLEEIQKDLDRRSEEAAREAPRLPCCLCGSFFSPYGYPVFLSYFHTFFYTLLSSPSSIPPRGYIFIDQSCK